MFAAIEENPIAAENSGGNCRRHDEVVQKGKSGQFSNHFCIHIQQI